MKILTLHMERLLLKPLKAGDAPQIRVLYPRREIVRYIVSSMPWPYPDNGVENYVSNVTPSNVKKGITWIWTTRLREVPDTLIGLICLYDVEGSDRGLWLTPEYQGQGSMREVSNVVTNY